MKFLAPLVALLLAGLSSYAATVTGLVVNVTGTATQTNILFTPTPAPGTSGGSIVAGSSKLVIATNGAFSTELVGGRYTVRIAPRDPFIAWVPSSGTWNLADLYRDANGGVVSSDAPFLPKTGGDMSGNIRFAGVLSGGVIPPYLTTAQRDALNVVSNGMTIWNVSLGTIQAYQDGVWTNLGGASGSGVTFTTASNAAFALRTILVYTNTGPSYSVTNLNAITYLVNTNSTSGGGGGGAAHVDDLNFASNALRVISYTIGTNGTNFTLSTSNSLQAQISAISGPTNGFTGAQVTNAASAIATNVVADRTIQATDYTFGQEYLSSVWFNRILTNQVQVVMSGDSTFNGAGITDSAAKPHVVLSNILSGNAAYPVKTINRGIDGQTMKWWSTNGLYADLAFITNNSAQLLMIGYGANDPTISSGDPTVLSNSLRTALQVIRYTNGLTYTNLSILVLTPQMMNDPSVGKSRAYFDSINAAYRALAGEFQCAFFDRNRYWLDGTNRINAMDGTTTTNQIHSRDGDNRMILSKVADFILPSMFKANGVVSVGSAYRTPAASDLPPKYNQTYNLRATTGNGFPYDGGVFGSRNDDGTFFQINYAFATNLAAIRMGGVSTWHPWVDLGFYNPYSTNEILSASAAPQDLLFGVSLYRAPFSSGWTNNGLVLVQKIKDGPALQINADFGGAGLASIRSGNGATWSDWREIGNVLNVSSAYQIPAASALPPAWTNGITLFRATSTNGFPSDGVGTTFRHVDGMAIQIVGDYQGSNSFIRTGFTNWFAWGQVSGLQIHGTNVTTLSAQSARIGRLFADTNNTDVLTTTNFRLASASTPGYVLAVQGDGVTIAPGAVSGGGGSGTNFYTAVYPADSTATIQAAIDAGKPVMFTPGSYTLTGLVGTNGTFLFAQTDGTALLTLASNANTHFFSATNRSNIRIEGLAINANGTQQSAYTNHSYYATNQSSGLYFERCTNVVVTRNSIRGAQFAGVLNVGSQDFHAFKNFNTGSNLFGSFVVYRRFPQGSGWTFTNDCWNTVIEDNTASWDGCDIVRIVSRGVTIRGGFYDFAGVPSVVPVGFAGVYVEDSPDIVIEGVTARFNSGYGIDIGTGYMSGPELGSARVWGNYTASNSASGLTFSGSAGGIAGMNVAYNNGTPIPGLWTNSESTTPHVGIYMNNATNWNLVGNNTWDDRATKLQTNGILRSATAIRIMETGNADSPDVGVSFRQRQQYGFQFVDLVALSTTNAAGMTFGPSGTNLENSYLFQGNSPGSQGSGILFVDSRANSTHNIVTDNSGASSPWGISIKAPSANGAWNNSDPTNIVIKPGGTLAFQGYGAGTLTTDSAGTVTATSDERLKHIVGLESSGLDEVSALNPIRYRWNAASGNETNGVYSGFSAQDVQRSLPIAVGQMPDGMLTVQDRAVLAALVNAVKELKARVEELEARTP